MKKKKSKIRYYGGKHATIYIPATITTDSAFPFNLETEEVTIEINKEGKELIIKQEKKNG